VRHSPLPPALDLGRRRQQLWRWRCSPAGCAARRWQSRRRRRGGALALAGLKPPGLHGLLEGTRCVRSSPVGWAVANVAINNGRSDPNGELAAPGAAGAEHHHRDTQREALSQRSGGRRQEDRAALRRRAGSGVAMVRMKG
jgi:hypothetical protein